MTCCTARSHIVDSRFFRTGYTTEEARRVFCDDRRLQRWLEVEAALALTQAELGCIPESAAREIQQTARLELLDREAIKADIRRTGHSLIPLLNAWQQITSAAASRYIHYGATTQDIQDTAQSLELREILAIATRDTTAVIRLLAHLAEKYRSLVTIGRTHGQHALPITLGAKFAGWLDEMLRNAARLQQCRQRIPVSQLFGGVGTMAAFAGQGLELLRRFSERLELAAPACAWHTARDRQAEFLSTMAILAGTLGKIANEIFQLARDEIGELEEPFHSGKIGSTTMPHKRNPETCEQVVVLARLIKNNAGLGFEGLINEHERDYRAIRLEWVTLTDSCLYFCGALDLMKTILQDLIVHEERIRRNVERASNLISTEALMFLVAQKVGKQAAHELLYDIAMEAHATGSPFLETLTDHPQLQGMFTPDVLAAAVAPENHIGLAEELTDQVLRNAESWLAAEGEQADAVSPCPLAGRGICDE